MDKKNIFIRFCILQGTYWSFYASFVGYITAYMISKGMSNTTLSLIVSAFMLTSFAGLLFWGRVSDAMKTNKKVFILGSVSATMLAIGVFSLADSVKLMAVLYPLFGFMVAPLATLLDAWVIASFPEKADAFGQSRAFASGSYAVVMLLVGQMISHFGYRVMIAATLFFLSFTIVNAVAIPDVERANRTSKKASLADIKKLGNSRPYMLLILILFLTGMCIAPINNMKIVIMQNVGGDVAYVGLDSFIGCLMQLPFLVMSGRLIRIDPKKRLVMIVFAQSVMALITLAAVSPAMVIIGSIFNNIGVGIVLPTMREITEASVGNELKNTAHSLADAAYNNVSAMLALTYAGALSDFYSIKTMIVVSLVIELVTLGIALINMKTFSNHTEYGKASLISTQ